MSASATLRRTSGGRLRGPYWTTVRLHRPILWTGLALVIAAAAVAVFLRVSAAAFPEKQWNCIGACPDTFLGFASASVLLETFADFFAVALLFLPLLIGAVVAGPMIARELESGTYRLAWTQSASPARWLATKLAVAAIAATALVLPLVGIFQFLRAPFTGPVNRGWVQRGVFEAYGPVLIAYSLLAVAIGALVGLLVRRTLPAMAIAGVVSLSMPMAVGTVRWDVFPVRTVTGEGSGLFVGAGRAVDIGRDSFLMQSGYVTASGERLPYNACWRRTRDMETCPADLNITSWYIDFHPHSHFWWVTFAETAIMLALAAAAAWAAFRLLRRSAV
ncbi:ABC transporter permease [Streptomyces himalayensis]|uniref:ABC transporter permease n=1 Tax=Streptomyces himalayensis subsp. himalayensis TaxID=2756131 RepID=A0A7W0I9R0_9ACTN|nr:ABC transporter permease [Streptomyces himalayensis]MBA2947314.1 ABC transporter permease [Streptomyces himalayensis subsp. himalayensis]